MRLVKGYDVSVMIMVVSITVMNLKIIAPLMVFVGKKTIPRTP